MTPQRKKYFAQCSDKEKILRHRISGYLFEIQREKYLLNTEGGLVDMDRYKSKLRIKRYKYHLNAYRHELARIKGMDRMVVPRNAYIGHPTIEPIKRGEWINTYDDTPHDPRDKNYWWHCSECGHSVSTSFKSNFCPCCGARMEGD